MKLSLPVKNVYVTQPWGLNYVGFYKKLGFAGHNGIDFRARKGYPVYSAHSGVVTWAGKDGDGGISVSLISDVKGNGFKTIYYHLSEVLVQKGIKIKEGQMIGKAGNTGKYTTGAHLHFGLKETYNGDTLNRGNGYNGAIDPSPHFPKNWDKSRSYHRYGRKGNYLAELKVRFKNPWLHRQLIKRGQLNKIYNNEFINALVYGGYALEDVLNPALYYDGWGWIKKDEFMRGIKPFN